MESSSFLDNSNVMNAIQNNNFSRIRKSLGDDLYSENYQELFIHCNQLEKFDIILGLLLHPPDIECAAFGFNEISNSVFERIIAIEIFNNIIPLDENDEMYETNLLETILYTCLHDIRLIERYLNGRKLPIVLTKKILDNCIEIIFRSNSISNNNIIFLLYSLQTSYMEGDEIEEFLDSFLEEYPGYSRYVRSN